MTYENENGTLTDLSRQAESNFDVRPQTDDESDDDDVQCHVSENDVATASIEAARQSERAEYERLIRTRFKEFYTDDTQKMINKRFKRYKSMEQRIIELEAEAELMRKRESELDALVALERDKASAETERRIVSELLAQRARPSENGYSPRRAPAPFNVSALTKSQRADIAKRAFSGEKISF